MTECLRRMGDGDIVTYLTNMVTGWARLWFTGKSPASLSWHEALVILEKVDAPQVFAPWALVLCNGEGEKGFQ